MLVDVVQVLVLAWLSEHDSQLRWSDDGMQRNRLSQLQYYCSSADCSTRDWASRGTGAAGAIQSVYKGCLTDCLCTLVKTACHVAASRASLLLEDLSVARAQRLSAPRAA